MHAFDRRTDGRTDRQTDRIPIAIPRLHSMQRGKNALECFLGPTVEFRPHPLGELSLKDSLKLLAAAKVNETGRGKGNGREGKGDGKGRERRRIRGLEERGSGSIKGDLPPSTSG